jgi:hypothetical protein
MHSTSYRMSRLIDDLFQIWWTCSLGLEDNLQLHEKSAHRFITRATLFPVAECARLSTACSCSNGDIHSPCAGMLSGISSQLSACIAAKPAPFGAVNIFLASHNALAFLVSTRHFSKLYKALCKVGNVPSHFGHICFMVECVALLSISSPAAADVSSHCTICLH